MATPFLTTLSQLPEKGAVTWDSEGTEGGKFHSRKLHVPTEESGLTLGRGYDMKSRTAAGVLIDLIRAGLPRADAEKISKGAGLRGKAAKRFVVDNRLEDFEITPAAQKRLFEIAYDAEAAEAKRIATKEDVRAKYGATDWGKLDPAIQEILVDLKFRGDYTPAARTRIQKYVAANDLESFAKQLADETLWAKVPPDRFKRRKKFLEEAVARRRAEGALRTKAAIPRSQKGRP
jgi:hypothetical protein